MGDKKISNFSNSDLNPCFEESILSTQCLEKNDYDHNKCAIFFANYNQCKKFWGFIASKRKQAGIFPVIPTAKERQIIFDKWKEGKKIISDI